MAEDAILGYLEKNEEIEDSGKFAEEHGLDHNEIVNVVKSLHGFRYVNAQVVGQDDIKALKARKLIFLQTWKGYFLKKGPSYAPRRRKVATDLTRENLQRCEWKELEFKEYNFRAKGLPSEGGHLHPLLRVRQQIKDIFRQMGFEEMPTNNFVESSFWNFDALFQPQQHPAGESHDTFFLQDH